MTVCCAVRERSEEAELYSHVLVHGLFLCFPGSCVCICVSAFVCVLEHVSARVLLCLCVFVHVLYSTTTNFTYSWPFFSSVALSTFQPSILP